MSKFLVMLKKVERWYQLQRRILPWRENPSVYRVWISEIMLQQTQVITVIPYFEKFMNAFPTVESLAHAEQEKVLIFWAGLGYYSRARNLHKGAKKIVLDGRFPASREEWLEVPGVGAYTAGAILSIASHLPEPILDGNVERVLSRLRRVSRQKGDKEFKSRLWKLSRIMVESGFKLGIDPSVINQALMELGAKVCTPRAPKCTQCPLSSLCQAWVKGEQLLFPPLKKRVEWVRLEEKMICVMNSKGEILLRKREPGEWRAGLWDLLETLPQGLQKSAEGGFRFIGQVETHHVVTSHKIHRVTDILKLQSHSKSKLLQAAESSFPVSELRWVSVQEPQVAVGSALKKVLDRSKKLDLFS